MRGWSKAFDDAKEMLPPVVINLLVQLDFGYLMAYEQAEIQD